MKFNKLCNKYLLESTIIDTSVDYQGCPDICIQIAHEEYLKDSIFKTQRKEPGVNNIAHFQTKQGQMLEVKCYPSVILIHPLQPTKDKWGVSIQSDGSSTETYKYDVEDNLINKKIIKKKRDESGTVVSQIAEFFTGKYSNYTVKYIDENGVVHNADIKYDEQGRMIYYHMLETDSNLNIGNYHGKEIKHMYKYRDNHSNTLETHYILQDGVEHFYGWDEKGRVVHPTAAEKAKKYNDLYHGLFLHSCWTRQILSFLTKTGEVCISTVRSNTAFDLELGPWVLIGFGHLRQLFDWDAYTYIDHELAPDEGSDELEGGRTNPPPDGSRVHTMHSRQSSELHNVDYKNVPKSSVYPDFNEDLYYDEGLMRMESAEIILVVIGKCTSIEEQKTKNLIKQHYPYVKFLTQQQFSKIKKSEELLRLVYKTKQEQKADEIKDGELGMYDEKVLSSFKMYLNHTVV